MTELVAGFLAWIAAHAAYDLAPAPPAVRIAGDICAEVGLEPGCRIRGYYNHRTGTVILHGGWSIDSRDDRGLLLHELVHHAQAAAGAFDFDTPMGRCGGGAEAFALMARWLAENGERERLNARRATRDACAAHFAAGAGR